MKSKRTVTVVGSGSTGLADALKAALAKEGNGVVFINEASEITEEQYAAISKRPRNPGVWISQGSGSDFPADVINHPLLSDDYKAKIMGIGAQINAACNPTEDIEYEEDLDRCSVCGIEINELEGDDLDRELCLGCGHG